MKRKEQCEIYRNNVERRIQEIDRAINKLEGERIGLNEARQILNEILSDEQENENEG